jgi:hypothetical protein
MFEDIFTSDTKGTPILISILEMVDYIKKNFSEQPEILVKKLIYDEILDIFLKHRQDLSINVLYLNFNIIKKEDDFVLNPLNIQTQKLFERIGLA